MKLPVTLYVDDDGWFVVSCPTIPGCASQGRTEEEALANIREAIQLCLEVRKEEGLPLTIETREVEVPAVAYPRVAGAETIRALARAGSRVARIRGSHHFLVRDGSVMSLSIPLHKELAPGLLRDQIARAGLSVTEFIDLLD